MIALLLMVISLANASSKSSVDLSLAVVTTAGCSEVLVGSKVSSNTPIVTNRDLWDRDLSDPQNINPDQFFLALHAVPRGETRKRIEAERRIFEREKGIAQPSKMIDLIDEPWRIEEIPRLSFSLVSETRTFTLGPSGVILKFAGIQLLSTLAQDSRTGGWRFSTDTKALVEENRRISAKSLEIFSPQELINRTAVGVHNEGIIETNTGGHKARVIGFFYKIDDDGNLLISPSQLNALKLQSELTGLPLISIRGSSWRNDMTGIHNYKIP